jgi:predicted MFS family arabinose efflux permease
MRLSRAEWTLLILLASVQFTNVLDFMIVMPLGPTYMDKMNLSPSQFGWVASAYGYAAAASGLLAAMFMDRFDRKRSLLVIYAGFIVATLLCGAAYNYPLLLLGRALAGSFGGIMGAAVLSIVGDAFHDSRRGRAMGTVMSAFSVASITGVPLGLELARCLGLWAPFVGIGSLATLVFIGVAVVMPPMRGHLDRAADDHVSLAEILTRSRFLRAYGLVSAMMVSGFILMPFMTAFLVFNVGRPESDLKWVYLTGGLATVVTMNVAGRLSDRYGKLRMFRILALGTILPLIAFTNLPPVSLGLALIVTTVFWVISSGRMVPGMALIVSVAAPRYRGQFQSITAMVQHLSMAVGASLGGFIIGRTETKALTHVAVTGLVGAGFIVLSVVLAGRLHPAHAEVAPPAAPPDAEPQDVAMVA